MQHFSSTYTSLIYRLFLGLLISSFLFLGTEHTTFAQQKRPIEGNVGPDNIEAAYDYKPHAAKLGAPDIVFANINKDNTQMLVEYLPADQTLKNWTRMVTVVITPIDEKKDADGSQIGAIMGSMRRQIKKHDPKAFFDVYGKKKADGKKEYAAFFHYHIGSGPQREHNAGIIWRKQPNCVVNLQLQKRAGDLTSKEMEMVKNILSQY